MEEGVDTVGYGVLLLFAEDKTFFGNLGWRRVLTQLVKGCCGCLRRSKHFRKSWVEEGVDTVGNGVLWLFAEDKTFLEILGGGGC